MALAIYLVRYTVPAPPAYKGDPYQRTSFREKFVVTDSTQSAIDYVTDQLNKDGVAYSDVRSAYYKPHRPEGETQ